MIRKLTLHFLLCMMFALLHKVVRGATDTATEAIGFNGFKEGDSCGVTSSDFFKLDFGGKYRVAGTTGCTFLEGDDETKTIKEDCFCSVDYNDKSRLSEWKWQCSDSVVFGPKEGKICPETVPVPKRLASVNEELAFFDPVPCNIDLNPTGQRDDPVCAYSDCDTGGSMSSICGCVNKTMYGMGDGVQWFCMHSTCSCTKEDNGVVGKEEEGSGATDSNSSSGYGSIANTKPSTLYRFIMVSAIITVVHVGF